MFTYNDIIHCQRPISKRIPMSRQHRAKQFAPFAALSGFETCVRKKERIFYPRPELSDDQKAELDRKIRLLTYGMYLSATCFIKCPEFKQDIGTFSTVSGNLCFIDTQEKRMRIDDTEILFSNIVELEGDCFDLEIPGFDICMEISQTEYKFKATDKSLMKSQ